MSFFGSMMGKIFGTTPAAAAAVAPHPPAADASAPAAEAPAADAAVADAPSSAQVANATAPAPLAPPNSIDVAAILDDLNEKNPETLDWRGSIVDLMKVLGLDSSLKARKELAAELHYTGDTDDSASMNIWLHQKMMELIAANGGKLPDDVKKF